jgi:hypothetical protein
MGYIVYNPLINGVAYDWANISIRILGHTVIGVESIEYSDDQEIKDNFGAGVRPVNRGYGNITTTAKITLFMEEVVSLQQLSVTGNLQDIPEFDIIVQYASKPTSIVTDIIRMCKFKSNKRSPKQNDTNITVDIDLITPKIDWHNI